MGYVEDYYSELIGELVPLAAAVADEACRAMASPSNGYERYSEELTAAKWNEVFHSTIDRLATERGIRRQSWQGIN